MKKSVRLKGQLRLYMQWPAIMTILLIGMNIWIYIIDTKAGILMSAFVAIYGIIACFLYFYNNAVIMKDLIHFATQYGVVQNTLLKELDLPYALLLEDGSTLWLNDSFMKVAGQQKKPETLINKIIPEITTDMFPEEEKKESITQISYKEREYEVTFRKVLIEGFSEAERLLELPSEKEYFIALYMRDVTDLNAYIKEHEEERLVAGLIYIDNYDEVIRSVEEVRQSLLVALVDRKINQYVATVDGIVKKLEKDKYFVVMKQKHGEEMQEDKFSLLEDVKSVNIGNQMSATLSIGLGLSEDTYSQSYDYARVAIDLALARGGDQAVIKNSKGITYYGGKKEQLSKNTRVKARVKAEALREFIAAKDKVMVMGHKLGDVDSFGAAIGICRAVTALEKKAYIVIDEITSSVRPLYEAIVEHPAFPEDLFIHPKDVEDLVDENTMTIVVDTNKPEMTECKKLLTLTKTIVVLDHHRQSSEVIENAVLSYIEPFASSTCEMVAEILQYIVDEIKIIGVEANCMYAGIIIDTNNFVNRTGVRTFEAAAFLRRSGADITMVRKMFREDMESYQAKADTIRSAKIYKKQFALAKCTAEGLESPTIIGAQASNELLDIDGIKASFVLTEYNEKIYLSARSIDEVNVQVIAERLGGGGHMNTAGAQFAHTNMHEAMEAVKQVLDDMSEGGDI